MITIYARDKGINVNSDIGIPLFSLLNELSKIKEEKTLIFDSGNYYINSNSFSKEILFITNTIGDNEWEKEDKPHVYNIAILLKNIENLKINFNFSCLLINGVCSNLVIKNCHNILIENLILDVVNPKLHTLKVIKKGRMFVDFELDKDSLYSKGLFCYYFNGDGYKTSFYKNKFKATWIGKTQIKDENNIRRVKHPFILAYRIKELNKNIFRVFLLNSKNFDIGDTFSIYSAKRDNVGIFVEDSSHIEINNITQYFNYSLAYVAQTSENLIVKNCRFSPKENSGKMIASLADFIQICMCKGNIEITNNYFEGAGDDCLNIHGVYFIVSFIEKNVARIKFSHSQTHGFNPIKKNDVLEIVDRKSLFAKGSLIVLDSKLVNEYEIEIKFNSENSLYVGDALENITCIPNLLFKDNYISRIITRGLLISVRGRVEILNNHFKNTTASSILVANDANNWFESGNVHNMRIENNYFEESYDNNIHIESLNKPMQAIHNNIIIRNNKFKAYPKGGIYLKSTENSEIFENKIENVENFKFQTKYCVNIKSDL